MRRWAEPLGGLLFAALVVAALAVFGDQPGNGASADDVLAYYGGATAQVLLGDALWLAAAAAFGAFLLAVRHRLETDVDQHPWLAAIGTVAASTGLVLFSLSAVLGAILAVAAAAGQIAPAAALTWWQQENATFALSLPCFGVALLEAALGLWRSDMPARLVAAGTAALGLALLVPGWSGVSLPLLLVWAAGGSLSLLLDEAAHRPLGRPLVR